MSFPGQSIRKTARTLLSSGLVLVATTVLAGNAFAVSLRVQIACAGDYYAQLQRL